MQPGQNPQRRSQKVAAPRAAEGEKMKEIKSLKLAACSTDDVDLDDLDEWLLMTSFLPELRSSPIFDVTKDRKPAPTKDLCDGR
jgi:hypothetical protein